MTGTSDWVTPLPSTVEVHDGVSIVSLSASLRGLRLPGAQRLLWLHRYLPWWLKPEVGTDATAIAPEAMLLLWERRDGGYGCALPLAHGDKRAYLAGGESGLDVVVTGTGDDAQPLLAIAGGEDPYALVERVFSAAAKRLGTFTLRTDKRTPPWIDYLGWCTWDAFYSSVTERGVIDGLQAFRDAGVQPKFMILDDGWLDQQKSLLRSFDCDRAKFPSGIAGLVQRAKQEFGVELFGVWHAFQGYWAGVDPLSGLAERYCVLDEPINPDRFGNPLGQWHGTRRCLVHPADAGRFFDDFHAELRRAGVDMIKVDNQGSHDQFGGTQVNAVESAKAYQDALQASAAKHFGGNLLCCMSMSNEHALHHAKANVFRNSDDYFPRKNPAQTMHVHTNAKNALWTSQFSTPDWDMFYSVHPSAGYHAAARAISGGPIYVSDKPGVHDATLLKSLFTLDGKALRCEEPALPTLDCLFVDCESEPVPLKVMNRNGRVGVLALFHCQWVGEKKDDAVNAAGPVRGAWSPDDVRGLAGESFAAWSPVTRSLRIVTRGERVAVTLPPLGYDLLHLSPIDGGVAPLGLLDKLNGSCAIESTRGACACRLRDGGRFGFFAARKPREVRVDGKPAPFGYDGELVTAEAPEGAPHDVELVMT